MQLSCLKIFCFCLIAGFITGCIAVPVPLLPGDGIYEVEADIEQLIESNATKTDVINELGIPLKYRTDSMSYKACRKSGGVGLFVAFYMSGGGIVENRNDVVCVELLLIFDNADRLSSYQDNPWLNNIDHNNEETMLSKLAIEGDKAAMYIIELTASTTNYPEYEKYLLMRLERGDTVPVDSIYTLYLFDKTKNENISNLCRIADMGHTKAQIEVARIYSRRNDIENYQLKSYMWYVLAATTDFSNGLYVNIKAQESAQRKINYKKEKILTEDQLKTATQLLLRWTLGQCQLDLATYGAYN